MTLWSSENWLEHLVREAHSVDCHAKSLQAEPSLEAAEAFAIARAKLSCAKSLSRLRILSDAIAFQSKRPCYRDFQCGLGISDRLLHLTLFRFSNSTQSRCFLQAHRKQINAKIPLPERSAQRYVLLLRGPNANTENRDYRLSAFQTFLLVLTFAKFSLLILLRRPFPFHFGRIC